MTRPPIEHFYYAIMLGLRSEALSLLHPDFRHEGRDGPSFVDHEMGQFRQRGVQSGLLCSLQLPEMGLGMPRHALIHDGMFIFETAMAEQDGLLLGNGLSLEVVPKLIFENGVLVGRGLYLTWPGIADSYADWRRVAIRSGGEVWGGSTEIIREADGSVDALYVQMTRTESDSFNSQLGIIRSLETGERVGPFVLPGIDHPYFRPDLSPVIQGETLHLNCPPSWVWSLTVWVEGGEIFEITPKGYEVSVAAPVREACMIDMLDNQWRVRCE